MNGHILQFEGRRHAEAQRLLPWLANGRLEGDEQAWVEQHVAGCPACRRELEELRTVQLACLQEEPEAVDTDAGWRRLRGRLRPARAAAPTWWQSLRGQWSQAPRWLAWTVAVQALLVAGLGVAVWRQPQPAPASYRTLGASPGGAGNLVIVFDPKLDEAQLRQLLTVSDARIVDGPNDAGAYLLAVPQSRLAAVRNALRAAHGVTLVESLGPERDK